MDTFLITRLEALMNRSPVSPYDVARFLVPGAAMAWLAGAYFHGFDGFTIAIGLLLSVCWVGEYREIAKVERENAKGFWNRAKKNYGSRLAFLFFAVLYVSLCACLARNFAADFCAAYCVLTVAYRYLYALNWTPPPPKLVRRSVFAEGAV
jgi:hypothetical protein